MPPTRPPNGLPICVNHPSGPYYIRHQIASGSTCRVYHAKAPNLQAIPRLVAVKIIALQAVDEQSQKKILREVRIHEVLRHPHVLEMIAGEEREKEGEWPRGLYIVMQLAAGGDLFDKIPPDVGVPEPIAQLYFTQLISGLKYLASQGIVHRDIKPENLLLDSLGNLKITDFGLASVFKYKGKTRLLTDRCGSPPYAAPELARHEPYSGEPIDIWSAGIVLFALVVGNTPWDEPTTAAPEFEAYVSSAIWAYDPWNRISDRVRLLLKGVLSIDPAKRMTVRKIEANDWFSQYNEHIDEETGLCTDSVYLGRKMAEHLRRHGCLGSPTAAFEEMCQDMDSTHIGSQASQGMPSQIMSQASQRVLQQHGLDPSAGFQSSLRLYSRLSMAPSQRANPHTTRFFTTYPLEQLVPLLSTALSSMTTSPGPIPHDVLENEFSSASVLPHPFVVRLRFKHKDSRGEPLQGSINVTPGTLPPDPSGGPELHGFEVVQYKKVANPLELKRVWIGLLNGLPRGVVCET